MKNDSLYLKISQLPEDLQIEINDFVDFLISKKVVANRPKKSMFGSAKGLIYTSPDFDEPLDDFKEYM